SPRSRRRSRTRSWVGDLGVGVTAGLDVAGEADGAPAAEVAVAAVLRRGVRAVARVLVQQRLERRRRVEARVLLLAGQRREIRPEGGNAVPIPPLPPDDGTVELAFRDSLRPFDPRPPRQFLDAVQRQEIGERRFAATAARERTAAEYSRRVERGGAEQSVDEVHDAYYRRAGVPVERRDQPLARGF